MLVKEIMTPNAEWVTPDTRLKDVATKMRDKNVGSLPVRESERLVGMITDRDVCCRGVAQGRDPAKATAREVMSKEVTYCFDDQDIADAAHIMEENKIRRLPVLDHNERMVGMLTLGDFTKGAPHALTNEVMKAVAVYH